MAANYKPVELSTDIKKLINDIPDSENNGIEGNFAEIIKFDFTQWK